MASNAELLISVVVPVHNAAPWLSACLQTIAGQSHGSFQCLLVDDGSTDESPALCDAQAAADSRFTALHQPQSGVAAARAAGVAAAKGDWLAFCDADDLLHPAMLELLLATALDAKLPVACCRYDSFTEALPMPDATVNAPAVTRLTAPAHLEALLHDHRIDYSLCNKLFRRGVLTPAMLQNGLRYNEDLLACWLALKAAPGMAYADFIGYHYRQHSKSASHRPLTAESICQQQQVAAQILQQAADTPAAQTAGAFYYEKLVYLASMILRRSSQEVITLAPQLDTLLAALRAGQSDPMQGRNPKLPTSIRAAAFALLHLRPLARIGFRLLLQDRR